MPVSTGRKTSPGTEPKPTQHRNVGRNNQRVTFQCGHRGLGRFCHRCEQAKVLFGRAEKGVIVKWDHKTKPSKSVQEKATKDQIKAMQVEAHRLVKV